MLHEGSIKFALVTDEVLRFVLGVDSRFHVGSVAQDTRDAMISRCERISLRFMHQRPWTVASP